MFLYVYYSIGNGNHESTDDVAIIRAWSLKQARKILSQNVMIDGLKYELYRLKFPRSYRSRLKRVSKIKFISDY